MRNFQTWVADYGGPEKLAVKLGVSYAAVSRWLRRIGPPKVTTILKLVTISKGELTVEGVINDTLPAGSK